MSFLPYPGRCWREPPGATCSGLFSRLWAWDGACSPVVYTVMLWGFGTGLGVSRMASPLFSPPTVYIPDFSVEHSSAAWGSHLLVFRQLPTSHTHLL